MSSDRSSIIPDIVLLGIWSVLVNFYKKSSERRKICKKGNLYSSDFVIFRNASGCIVHANYSDLGWVLANGCHINSLGLGWIANGCHFDYSELDCDPISGSGSGSGSLDLIR